MSEKGINKNRLECDEMSQCGGREGGYCVEHITGKYVSSCTEIVVLRSYHNKDTGNVMFAV